MDCFSSKEVTRVENQTGLRTINAQQALPRRVRPSQPTAIAPLDAAGSATAKSWSTRIQQSVRDFHFSVRVVRFEVHPNRIPCWVFISEGLENVNQHEIAFTISKRGGEQDQDYPEAPIKWIRLVGGLALGGYHLKIGQMCDITIGDQVQVTIGGRTLDMAEPESWQEMRNFGMLVHGNPMQYNLRPHRGTPPGCHHVIALTPEEAAAARTFGVSRVVAHIGQSLAWFPCPPWNDRDRGNLITQADLTPSFMSGVSLTRIHGISVCEYADRLQLTIPEDKALQSAFQKQFQLISPTNVLGFESYMSEDANTGTLWRADLRGVQGYTSLMEPTNTPRIINAAFLVIGPDSEADKVEEIEDGRILFLTETNFVGMQTAVKNLQDIKIPLADSGKFFELRWSKTTYTDLFSPEKTVYPAVWLKIGPQLPPGRLETPLLLTDIVFLGNPVTGTVQVPQEAEALKDYVHMVEQVIQQVLAGQTPTNLGFAKYGETGLLILITIQRHPTYTWIEVAFFPTPDYFRQLREEIAAILAQIPSPVLTSVPLPYHFRVVGSVWGYDQRTFLKDIISSGAFPKQW